MFDADAETNPDVAMHGQWPVECLVKEGAKVKIARLPPVAGHKTGLDDYLYNGGDVADLLRSAKPAKGDTN